MSTVLTENEPLIAAQILSLLSGRVTIVQPEGLFMGISIPNLGGHFRFEITALDDSEVEDGRVLIKTAIDPNVSMIATLNGESDATGFRTTSVGFRFETVKKTAESDFRLATLRAGLSLATNSRLVTPGLGLDFWFRLNESLRDISEMLKLRQTMYRLMVIERATGVRFRVPSFIEGEDMQSISLLYHAITERSFGWPFDGVLTVFYEADKELAKRFEEVNKSPDFSYPCSHHESLFGIPIPLGLGAITIISKNIEDFDRTLEELRMNDGHMVAVKVRSRIGLAHYNFREAPRLPSKAWSEDLQMFVNMESQLDAALVERYNDLAAASLAGLEEYERAEITARPTLGEAFLIDSGSGERVG